MTSTKLRSLPGRLFLTATLFAALITSGASFNVPPSQPTAAKVFSPAVPADVAPVPVESWKDRQAAAPAEGTGVDANAVTPADSNMDAAGPAIATVGLKTVVPMTTTTPPVPVNEKGAGNFMALPGVGSGSWGTTGQTGGFTWDYPFPIRQAPAGATPNFGLSYDSTRVDGLTSATNNQGTVVGEGWGLAGSGTIRQKLGSCKDQLPAGTQTWDLCGNPGGQEFTISFGSRSGLIIKDANGKYHLQADDNTRLEFLSDTSTGNGTRYGDYWKVTDPEGTEYYFGLNRIPGWTSGKATTNSTDYVPVRAATSTQPCADIGTALCQQAYAWNLDYVVDVHGNSQAFYYTQDLNYYASAAGTGPRHVYVRASRLARVDYGMREGTELTAKAPMQVHFGYTGRCEGGTVCAAAPGGGLLHDVPEKFTCATTTCDIQAPTFYTYYRLQTVISQTLVGSSYGNADVWTLRHWMPDPEDGTKPNLWLHEVVHQGADTTTTGATQWITDPATIFNGWALPNRVWDVASGQAPMNRIRLGTITNSTGAMTSIKYLATDCTKENIGAIVPQTNTKRCFPQWWVPVDPDPEPERRDYFNVYPVKEVSTTPSPDFDGSAAVHTEYEYNGNPVWKYAGAKIDTSTGGSKKTWSVFGGYGEVLTRTGADASGYNPYTLTTYLRGNNGTPADTAGAVRAASVTTSDGTIVTDSPWLAGRVLEKRSYRSTGGAYLSSTINVPWTSAPTAKATAALGAAEAHYTGSAATKTTTASSKGSGTRITYSTNTFDALGRVTTIADHGEYATAITADNTCTTISYADNTAANMLKFPAVTATFKAVCVAGAPDGDLLRYTRTLYDNSTSAVPGSAGYVAPTKADKTRTDTATAISGVVVTGWQTGPTNTYDALGRPTKATDLTTGATRTTTTAYAPTTGAVTTVTSTNSAGWPTTTTFDSIRGNKLRTVDPNSHETSTRYDQSGRETAAWDARRPQASNGPSVTTSYSVSQTSPSWVQKTVLNGLGNPTVGYTIYDGMGRIRQTQAQSPGKGTIVTDTLYNSAGSKDLERHAYYVSTDPNGVMVTPTATVPSSTRYQYDTYGRISTVRAMGGENTELWKTEYAYTGVDTTTTTRKSSTWSGSPETTVVNTHGKIESRTLYQGTTATGVFDKSTYVYDVFDQLTGMGDGSNLWTWAYDAAGRKTTSVDPDSGTTTTAYDNAGRVASRSDALATVSKYFYDSLDRVTKQTVTPAGGTENTLITNTYDTGGKLGPLSSSTRNNGATFNQPVTTAYSGFDLAYTPGTTKTTLPSDLTWFNGTYTFTNTTTDTGKTDVAGTPLIAGLPAETIDHGYDAFDNPTAIKGSGHTYAGDAQYTHLGQLASYLQRDSASSSGTNTTGINDVTFTWDAWTGRLDETQAQNTVGFATSDLGTTRYTYDPAGRITAREQDYTTRLSPTDLQCYSYDHADRVKAVWTPAATSCGTAPAASANSVTGLGGPAPYAQTYTYTPAGDRSQVKRFGSNGTLAVTESYAYPAPGTVGPHRTQSVTSVPGTPSVKSFTWDAAGRMTGRAGQILTYTLDGQLDTSTGTATLPSNPNPNATAGTPPTAATGAGSTGARYYDAAGNLVGIKDGAGTTITLGSITAHATPAGAKTATKTYNFAGKVVAQRTATSAGTKLAFIIGDSVNTAQTMTMPNTGTGPITAIVRRTDPFGLARGTNGAGTGDNAFTPAADTTAGTGSNAASATGFGAANGYIAGFDDTVSSLTHLGAREMDPVIGVFTAPDPILDTGTQARFTPYTYAFGDPINSSDPSGLSIQQPIRDTDGGNWDGHVYQSDMAAGNNVIVPYFDSPPTYNPLITPAYHPVVGNRSTGHRGLNNATPYPEHFHEIQGMALGALAGFISCPETAGLGCGVAISSITAGFSAIGKSMDGGKVEPSEVGLEVLTGAACWFCKLGRFTKFGGVAGQAAHILPSPSEAANLLKSGTKVGSALKNDDFHRAPDFVVNDIATKGSVFSTVGGDGADYLLVQMPGEVNGKVGRFEWMINGQNEITHNVFLPGGTINGIPNLIP